MPCNCEGAEREENSKLRRLANAATRAACDLRTILRRGGTEADLCEETRLWIARHDDWDRRRIEQEQAEGIRQRTKEAALAKLTLDERRVLGL